MPYVPGENAANAESRGGAYTETGYYRGSIKLDAGGPGSDPWTTRHLIELPTGISPSILLNWPVSDDGDLNKKITKLDLDEEKEEKKIQNYADYLFGVMLACGYTKEELAQGYHENWADGRDIFVAFVSGDDLGAEYGDIVGYVSGDPDNGLTAEQQFNAFIAEGRKPRAPKPRKEDMKVQRGEGGGSGRQAPPKRPSAGPPKRPTAETRATDNGEASGATMPPPKAGSPPRPPPARRA